MNHSYATASLSLRECASCGACGFFRDQQTLSTWRNRVCPSVPRSTTCENFDDRVQPDLWHVYWISPGTCYGHERGPVAWKNNGGDDHYHLLYMTLESWIKNVWFLSHTGHSNGFRPPCLRDYGFLSAKFSQDEVILKIELFATDDCVTFVHKTPMTAR